MFSVIIPLYNKEDYIERSIKSVLNQTYTDFELIIVDDASSDNSLQTAKQIKDSRIIIIERNERGYGGYAARNIGIENAKYEYISFLDADDEWNPDYLKNIDKLIQKFPEADVFACGWTEKTQKAQKNNAYYIRNHKRDSHIVKSFYSEAYLGRNPLCTIVVTASKEKLIKVGSFPAGKCKRGGDIETWMRLMKNNFLAWTPYIGAVYYKDIIETVTKTISDIEIPYVYYCVKELLKNEDNENNKFEFKKYSNYYAKMSILHSIVFNKNKKEVFNGFYKDVDKKLNFFFKFLMFFPSFILIPLFRVYRFFKMKFSKSDLG